MQLPPGKDVVSCMLYFSFLAFMTGLLASTAVEAANPPERLQLLAMIAVGFHLLVAVVMFIFAHQNRRSEIPYLYKDYGFMSLILAACCVPAYVWPTVILEDDVLARLGSTCFTLALIALVMQFLVLPILDRFNGSSSQS